jgi:FtsP/CotA-like multicopper oxidase with cupredoxin domain
MTTTRRLLAAAILSVSMSPALAVEYYLSARELTKTMPDGSSVTMWGYAQGTLNGDNTVTYGAATVPGPQLVVPPGDTTLTIHLENALPQVINGGAVPTSVVVPGQATTMTPVKFSAGPFTGRVRSFTHETAAAATVDYTWTNLKPGTFLYQSGTHQQVQVQMGLYGAVVVQPAAGQAYPGVVYDKDVTLVYSEVDPALHAAVADGSYGSATMPSTLNYAPRYFLVNGQSYSPTSSPVVIGLPGETALLRLVNAGLETHAPMLLGTHMTLIAEDGSPYPYPSRNFLATLTAGKTMDATLVVPAPGQAYPLFDRRLRLANASTPSSASGMISILRAGGAPTAGDDAATTPEDTAVTIAVLANDSDPDGYPLTVTSATAPSNGTALINGDNTITYTPAANFNGTDSFTYTVTDAGALTATATVTVTVTPVNDTPVANDDLNLVLNFVNGSGQWIRGASGSVLLNDTDTDSSTLTPTLVSNIDPAKGSVTLYTNGGFAYNPPLSGPATGLMTFTYRVSDGTTTSNTATVSFRVNRAPVAVDDGSATNPLVLNFVDGSGKYLRGSAGSVLGNDTDADGDALTTILVSNIDPAQGTVTLYGLGNFAYTPPAGGPVTGNMTFTYKASDGKGGQSNTATVTFRVNRAPVAVNDAYTLTTLVNGTYYYVPAATGVLANDTDADGDALTTILVSNVAEGSVTLYGLGAFRYTPPAGGPSGPQTFTYKASDGKGGQSNTATVTLTVGP